MNTRRKEFYIDILELAQKYGATVEKYHVFEFIDRVTVDFSDINLK